jgi:hypothetical protein
MYKRMYRKQLADLTENDLKKDKWVLIFSRSQNFGEKRGTWIDKASGLVKVTDIFGRKKLPTHLDFYPKPDIIGP